MEQVLPHTVNQILRFFDAKRKLLAEVGAARCPLGWPKRNGFVQPMVDAELLVGVDRFDSVEVRWGHLMENCTETPDVRRWPCTVGARYVVGCDGGRPRHPGS